MTAPTGAAGTSPTAAVAAGLADTVARLGRSSRATYQNPYEALDWPEAVDPDESWFTSPELSSLAGTPAGDALGEAQRRRLSFWEAVNFFSLNIHGERALMEGLAHRLYRPDLTDVAPYLHHFLDEENKHSVYFGGFCRRYAHVYPDRKLVFAAPPGEPGEDDFLFFARVLIFEELVDRYNVAQGRDERLHPVARFINRNHHTEETRHLAFGRQLVAGLWQAWRPRWDADVVARIRDHLAAFVLVSWREYYNPHVYRDAGLDDPWAVADEAWRHPAQRAHRRAVTARCQAFLRDHEILDEVPTDDD
jgi:P-aminobenzoate N-oxygenase AurF